MGLLPLSAGPAPVCSPDAANEANADQDPGSAKHSSNSIDRRHDCDWRTAFGSMGKDEGDTGLGFPRRTRQPRPAIALCKAQTPKRYSARKKNFAIQGCNYSKPKLKQHIQIKLYYVLHLPHICLMSPICPMDTAPFPQEPSR